MLRRRMLFSQARLPAEYQEVEWIGASGTQAIDTGLYIHEFTKIETDFAYTLFNAGYQFIWGLRSHSGYKVFGIHNNKYSYREALRSQTDLSSSPVLNTFNKYIATDENSNYTVYCDNTKIIDITTRIYSSQYDDTLKLLGFFGSGATAYNYLANGKIKPCIISNGSVVVRELVPCYNKTTGVIGMYDLCGSICPLTNTPFYINAGTGTFTKGADVL